MIPKSIILLVVSDVAYPTFHIVGIHITPGNGHVVHGNHMGVRLIFVTPWLWQTKGNLHVSLRFQSFGDTKTGRTQTTEDMRRILPSKHQYFHLFILLFNIYTFLTTPVCATPLPRSWHTRWLHAHGTADCHQTTRESYPSSAASSRPHSPPSDAR